MSRSPKRYYRGMTLARAEEIRRRYFAREAKQPQLAREFGIKQGSVSRIISGQVWAR
jgi:DNA-binding transcriptional regulator LsrR (DeoR family)